MHRFAHAAHQRGHARLTLTLVAVLLFGLAGLTQARPAAAQATWCWIDPIVEINGHRINIDTGVQGTPAVVQAHVQHAYVTIYVPRGAQYRLIEITSGYYTESVRFVEVNPNAQVGVTVSFAATRDLPAAMVITSGSVRLTFYGSTGAGVNAMVIPRW